jgi:lipoprotein-anchoring transpeptidase ErfK/SrfK
VLDMFDGGLPEIAIHGTNQPELMGQARSNGCIRLPNDAIQRLAEVVPLGTPVEIVA